MKCCAAKLHHNLFIIKWFKQWLRNAGNKNLSLFFASSLCCLHRDQEHSRVWGSHPLKKDQPKEGSWCFRVWFFFLRRANRLLGTYWRTCNCSLTTSPKSSNFWVGTYLKAAACRMSPASCRELGHFSLSDWDWGEESFSSERKKELQCRQFGQLETGWQIASHWHFIHFQPMGPFLQPDKSPPMLQKSKFLTLLFLYGKEA